jgi:hypothetical protein
MLSSLRLPIDKNSPDKIQLARIGHVYVEHVDLGKFEIFAANFGFVEPGRSEDTIYYRIFGKDPYAYVATKSISNEKSFTGGAFVV